MGALDAFGPATRAWFEQGFVTPTTVQELGWPRIASGKHVLMVAPTGSGKTLAAFLAGLDRVMRAEPGAPAGVRILYVSPLKALVYDIERNLRAPLAGIRRHATHTGERLRDVGVDLRTGDTPQKDRARQRRKPRDIMVTTPESLYLLLTSSSRETLRTVHTVILDEIHVMAGTKRGVHLALSLERLCKLTEIEPQRIGLSATVTPVEAAARFLGGDRPVQVVDTSEPPHIDLSVVVPVEDMENPPMPAPPEEPDPEEVEALDDDLDDPFPDFLGAEVTTIAMDTTGPTNKMGGIWPSIHPELLKLVRSNRSTILFVNSRILCERLCQALNELAGELLVHAHHGSISHERRRFIEEELKGGRVKGIVATSSLELGIDMGAVDMVVLVASPGSSARGLQRVGRAGHQVGALSRGRIFPKFRGDLLECAVVAERMKAGLLEDLRPPRNCLDVLSQQIVAMVAMEDTTTDELLATIRRAGPYAELSAALLTSVLDMLTGRYPSDEFSDLTPTINWDRATDALTPRRSARLLAIMNAGTIPDRGLYRVKVGSDGPIVGELDEEMVFESRPGDVIVLGASSWRIQEITRDSVEVTPAPGEPGRLAFWRGERAGRPIELGKAMGAFLREFTEREGAAAEAWLSEHTDLDALAARNLTAYVQEQREATGAVPTDTTIVIERFRDELGDWRVCILTPFGSRVHAPWALAIEASLAEQVGFDIQTLWTDDGIAVRFADVDELPSADAFLPDPEDVEERIVEQLRHSAVFAAKFREAAGRALLIPRRRARGRTPLWLQRKKSQTLLAAAHKFESFPIILETYRECLQDVFDVPSLRDLLGAVRRREVRVEDVETKVSSPFARSLVFQFVSAYMYDGDAPLAERKAQALALDRELLRELLGQEALRDLLDADAVSEVEEELQFLAEGYAVRHADGLHDLLRRLGDLDVLELTARSTQDPTPWLAELQTARRALPVRIGGQDRWIAVEDAARYRDALGVSLPQGLPAVFLAPADEPLTSLLRRWARTHGPFLALQVASRWGLTEAVLTALLKTLLEAGDLLLGELRPGGIQREWCDPDVLRRLRRRSLAKLRREVEPVEPEVLARFLPHWQGLGKKSGGLAALEASIDQLEGLPIPWSVLESEVLPARVPDYQPFMLDQLGATGAVVWVGHGALGTTDGKVALYRRERIGLLLDPPAEEASRGLPTALMDHLDSRGASFLAELQRAADGTPLKELVPTIWDLVWKGLITNDTFQPLRQLGAKTRRRNAPLAGGRWSTVAGLLGPAPEATERVLARARILLDRYGVVSRSVAQSESLAGGFSAIYPVLRTMEEAGRVRRGWFVSDFGGAQFALPGAVDRLRACRTSEPEARIVAAADPANAWGSLVPWPETVSAEARLRRVAGARVVIVDGVPAIYLNRSGKRVHVFKRAAESQEILERAVSALKDKQGYRTLRIDQVDGHPAHEAASTAKLLLAGAKRDYKGLIIGGR